MTDKQLTTERATKLAPIIDQDQMDRLMTLEANRKLARQAIQQAAREGNDVLAAIVTARAMQQLRDHLNGPLMEDVLRLMNSPLGFDTDRNPAKDPKAQPYGEEIVRDCVIQGMLMGFSPVGNQFNILAGRFYAAKEGLRRQVLRWPGLANLQTILGVPTNMGERGALVAASASWTLDGRKFHLEYGPATKDQPLDTRIAVRVNKGQGTDAILGKAERKLYARIAAVLSGLQGLDWDPDDPDQPQVLQAAGNIAQHGEGEEPQEPRQDDPGHDPGEFDPVERILVAAEERLSAAEQIGDCRTIGNEAGQAIIDLSLADDERDQGLQMLESMVERRQQAIRASRGTRGGRNH